jgi:uncharacterized protein YndB with AHSA1/START domain
MNHPAVTDRIEREIVLKAPVSRVWQALTDARQFGHWFGVELSGPFAPGDRVTATVTTEQYAGVTFDIMVLQMEPERLFSWRWHPGDIEPAVDLSGEPTTLVEFHLAPVAGGTHLRVIESGFDALPPSRRSAAYRANDHGWAEQMVNIERHVAAG